MKPPISDATPSRLVPARLDQRIHRVRGHNVLLDRDLAEMYGVDVRTLNQAVRRNSTRFPQDFMFRLTVEEAGRLRSQIVISKPGRGGRRYLPLAFTQEGVAMLSGVLRSECAVRVNIEIMRAFVRMRVMVLRHEDLARRLDALEAKHDGQFQVVFDALRELMTPVKKTAPEIGFRTRP